MSSEQGHWITKDGKRIFIKEDLIDKQYREIERAQQEYGDMNDSVSEIYTPQYDTKPASFPFGRREKSEKAIEEVKTVINNILKNAKKEQISPADLEDYIWNRIHDNFPYSMSYGDNIKAISNNEGKYEEDAIIDAVEIYFHVPWNGGNIEVELQGKSYYMSELDNEDLEYIGIYR